MAAATVVGIETPGRASLAQWLTEGEGRSQVLLAGWLGINSSSVSLWVSGRSRPDPHFRRALALLLGIAEDAWFTAEELAFFEDCKALAVALKPKRRKAPASTPPPATGKHPRGTYATRTGTEG